MYINKISGSMNRNIYKSNVSFNGYYRSIEVKNSEKSGFQARVAGNDSGSGVCRSREEAVYFAIRNSKDYVPYNKIEKLDKKDSGKTSDVLEVYFTDKNEKVNTKTVEPYADYIVFASGSGIVIYP